MAIRNAQATSAMTFGEQVEVVPHQMLLSGTATAEAVGNLVGISERTLRRRLEAEGEGLQGLLDQTGHVDPAARHVPSGHVPHGIANE